MKSMELIEQKNSKKRPHVEPGKKESRDSHKGRRKEEYIGHDLQLSSLLAPSSSLSLFASS